jgi:hypothetical protein
MSCSKPVDEDDGRVEMQTRVDELSQRPRVDHQMGREHQFRRLSLVRLTILAHRYAHTCQVASALQGVLKWRLLLGGGAEDNVVDAGMSQAENKALDERDACDAAPEAEGQT